jgi:murein DD-endopeptidase MepM/ murein hydrolase activator NlpD
LYTINLKAKSYRYESHLNYFYRFLLIVGLKFEIINIPTETVVRTKTNGTNTTISDSVNLLWPFSKDALIADYPFSSTFGPRLQASNSFAYDFHRGIDIPNPMRTPLYAVAAGTIFRSRLSESGDLYVALKLEHTQQIRNLTGLRYFYPIYRHLNESVVVENQTVTAGQLIGYSG